MKRLILIALIYPGISIAQTAADPCEQLGKPIKEEIRQLLYSGSPTPQIEKARALGAQWATVVLECKFSILNATVAAAQVAAVARAVSAEAKNGH